MNIQENENFVSVQLYHKNLYIKEILQQEHTFHLDYEKYKRYNRAIELNKYKNGNHAKIHITFLVDKNHKDGPELHCVSERGVIFILNKKKYEEGRNCLITVLLARPNQVIRLYNAIGYYAPKEIVRYCRLNSRHHQNK